MARYQLVWEDDADGSRHGVCIQVDAGQHPYSVAETFLAQRRPAKGQCAQYKIEGLRLLKNGERAQTF